LTWLFIAALIGIPAYLIWEDRRRRRLPPVEDPASFDLVGCVARVVESSDGIRVRVTDKEGVVRVLPARVEELDGEPSPDQELLVIEGPRRDRALLAVPAEIPGLEDLSG
jgi:hypothetical protein